jgi:hypothetical protein
LSGLRRVCEPCGSRVPNAPHNTFSGRRWSLRPTFASPTGAGSREEAPTAVGLRPT